MARSGFAGIRQGDLLLCDVGTTQIFLVFLGQSGGIMYAGFGRDLTWTFDALSGAGIGSTATVPSLAGGMRARSYIGPAVDPCLAALLWDGVLARLEGERRDGG